MLSFSFEFSYRLKLESSVMILPMQSIEESMAPATTSHATTFPFIIPPLFWSISKHYSDISVL